MSGGSFDIVMANYNNQAASSGLTPSSIHDKYIDRYSTTASGYSISMFGEAIYETSSSPTLTTSWYGDASGMPNNTSPWFLRGDDYGGIANAGPYAFNGTNGSAGANMSWRVVILAGEGL